MASNISNSECRQHSHRVFIISLIQTALVKSAEMHHVNVSLVHRLDIALAWVGA